MPLEIPDEVKPGAAAPAGTVTAVRRLLAELEDLKVTLADGPPALVERLLATAAAEAWRGSADREAAWNAPGRREVILVGFDAHGDADDLALPGEPTSVIDSAQRSGKIIRRESVGAALDLIASRTVTARRSLAEIASAPDHPHDADLGLTLLVSRIAPARNELSLLIDLVDEPGRVAALLPALGSAPVSAPTGKVSIVKVIEVKASEVKASEVKVSPAGTGSDLETIIVAAQKPAHQSIDLTRPPTPARDHATAAAVIPAAVIPASTTPASATPALATPTSATPALATPTSATPISAIPISAIPALATPISATSTTVDPSLAAPAPAAAPATIALLTRESAASAPAPERRPAARRPEPVRPSAAASLRIGMLGQLTINGQPGALLPAQTQLIVALAVNGPAGLANGQLCDLLGADADHPKPADSLRQLIARTRRQLGQADDGKEWIIHLGHGKYALHPDSRVDWREFQALTDEGTSAKDAGKLAAALSMIRGQPFTGCYYWWLDIELVDSVSAKIVAAAAALAELALAKPDPAAAARAARIGLVADATEEELWRLLMRAEHAAGNLAGVRDAWSRCVDAVAEVAADGQPQRATAALYRSLTGRSLERRPATS
jgi:DNA-binding SARP family transcriptional activator